MGASLDQPVADDPKTVGGVLTASLPAAISLGMFAIGALLVNIQIHSARMDASVQQLVKSIEELKTDSKAQLADLDKRVRVLEIRR
jgi:hypothetical protein